MSILPKVECIILVGAKGNEATKRSQNMAFLQHATTGNLNSALPASPPDQVDDLGPVILGTGAALIPITVIIAVVRIATGRIISRLHVDDCRQHISV